MRSLGRTTFRAMSVALAAAALVALGGGLATPAHAEETSCAGVMSGAGDGPLTKSLVSVTPGSTAGDYTIVYQLDSDRAAGVYRVRDCAFIDTGAPGYDGESFVGTVDEKETTFTPSTSGGSTATFTQEVSGVGPGQQVCDRAAVSGTALTVGFTDKSNVLCITPDNPPVISESRLAVTLPLAAVGALGAYLLLRRRAQARSVSAA